MRIIDKNTDFYDFYQNVYRDTSFTFDRRSSFVLTKPMVCDDLTFHLGHFWSWRTKKYVDGEFGFALLQVCNTFWLFLIRVTEIDKSLYAHGNIKDYKLELLSTWRDFNKKRELCKFDIISFTNYHLTFNTTKEKIYDTIDTYVNEIKTNNYKSKCDLSKNTVYIGDKKVLKDIPILKACGVGECVDAHEIYLAFEEYFSLEKTDSERREPIGTTDIDKVERHGFDKKVSFRGK